MADCPHCQAPVADPAPRFCDACGLALPVLRRAAAAGAAARGGSAADPIRCPECGLLALARRCRGCGSLVRWPDGVLPPDEQSELPGKPADAALELPEEVDSLELDDDFEVDEAPAEDVEV